MTLRLDAWSWAPNELLIEHRPAGNGELQHRQHGHQQQHGGGDGRGVGQIEVLECLLLDQEAGDIGGMSGTAARQREHLGEDLEGADHIDTSTKKIHGPISGSVI